MRRAKSLRIGVHLADAVVWEPVYRTHLTPHVREKFGHVSRAPGLQERALVLRDVQVRVADGVPPLLDRVERRDAGFEAAC